MPLFKKLKIEVKGAKRDFKVMFDAAGLFYCEPGIDLCNAVGGIEGHKVTAPTFDELFNKLHAVIRAFNELNTERIYTVHYKFHISSKIKRQMPNDLMDAEMWRKTAHYGGANQYYKDDVAININWYPCVTTKLGNDVQLHQLRPAEQIDFTYLESGRYYAHKPFSDLIFVQSDRIWNFYNEPNFFSIPLTAETYEFFNGIEMSFVGIITKMLSFLSQDQAMLMEAISKMALENRSQFLINK